MSADRRFLTRFAQPAPVAAPARVEVDPPWQPCGTCWGQRRIHLPMRDEPGVYVPVTCPRCLGVGEVPST